MGTWEEESSVLLEETQNEVNVDVSSNGTHHDKVDGDVEVEMVNDASRESEVKEEGDLVEKLERCELQNNDNDDSKWEDGNGEGENGEDGQSQLYPLRSYASDSKFGDANGEEGEGGEGEDGQLQSYPLRPYAVDCSFYIKTGTCKFGQNCRYNHPPKGDFQPVVDQEVGFRVSKGAIADAGTIECKYFLTPDGCKYGDACRYSHSTQKIESERVALNFLGLPIRPTAQECTFYLRNGSCGYGANCRFNHPDPGVAKAMEYRNSTGNGMPRRGATSFPRNYVGEPSKSFPVSHGASELSNGLNLRNGLAYGAVMSSFHQAMPPNPGWNQNQAFSSYPANKGLLPHQMGNNYSNTPGPAALYEKPMQTEEFPERPGEPDCDYFMKTGNCKYRSACRFNHPVTRVSKTHLPPLGPKGLYSRPAMVIPVGTSELSSLKSNYTRTNDMSCSHLQQQQVQSGEFPERPGQPECEYYMKTGQCKYKSACRFHHPRSRVPLSSQCTLSEKGLPLRPGARLCRNFEQSGMCKYGRNCLFNHPNEYSPTADEYSSTAQVAAPVHSSTNAATAAISEPSAPNNVESGWDDGWGM